MRIMWNEHGDQRVRDEVVLFGNEHGDQRVRDEVVLFDEARSASMKSQIIGLPRRWPIPLGLCLSPDPSVVSVVSVVNPSYSDGLTNGPRACSMAAPMRSAKASSPPLTATCSPPGSPSSVSPIGTESAHIAR